MTFTYHKDYEELEFTDWIETLGKPVSNSIDWAFGFLLALMS